MFHNKGDTRTSAGTRLSSRNASTSSAGATGAPAIPPSSCSVCSKTTNKKPALKCCTCFAVTHTACVPEWADIKIETDLNKIIPRTGLMWYCSKCLPKLPHYFYGPEVKPRLEDIDSKIENLTKLVSENYKVCKLYSQVVDDSKENNAETRALAEELNNRAKQEALERDRLERKQSAILHNLHENYNTHIGVTSLLADLGFMQNSAVKISRLGSANQLNQSKPRPVKIQFRSEVLKIDFLRLLNRFSKRDDMFATQDLTKEEQNKEYQLRMKRNDLASKNPEHNYRVRNGMLQGKAKSSETWTNLDMDGNPKDNAHPLTHNPTISTSSNSINSESK